ncbi:MAG: (2Fe-2S) ferredoxin domain-containing protein [Spirochaetales bacterium]|uniref:(2Fe-2S) ferredoxin domain-containing protein n=1 Tax=Candidatus Thalassospirochaeta sargassi TaxID=3119039 RepID=A0AAJ1IKV3_9SPIO|nr:(2Fe-2S) ferredoxin domain-containing protein [Spirochaetales bacterium]
MEKISIEICTGTTCYVMGASDLLTLEEHLRPPLSSSVKISGSTCLGICRDKRFKPPFVRVAGKLIAQASVRKVLKAVEAEYSGGSYAYDE